MMSLAALPPGDIGQRWLGFRRGSWRLPPHAAARKTKRLRHAFHCWTGKFRRMFGACGVKSLPMLSPISRPNVTPLGRAEAALNRVLSVSWDDGAVGKWPAGATAQSLAEAGHLSIAGAGHDRCGPAISCGS